MAAVGGSAGRDELMGFTVKELVTTLREEEKAASGAAARGKSVTKPHNLPHRETRSLFDRTKVRPDVLFLLLQSLCVVTAS